MIWVIRFKQIAIIDHQSAPMVKKNISCHIDDVVMSGNLGAGWKPRIELLYNLGCSAYRTVTVRNITIGMWEFDFGSVKSLLIVEVSNSDKNSCSRIGDLFKQSHQLYVTVDEVPWNG